MKELESLKKKDLFFNQDGCMDVTLQRSKTCNWPVTIKVGCLCTVSTVTYCPTHCTLAWTFNLKGDALVFPSSRQAHAKAIAKAFELVRGKGTKDSCHSLRRSDAF
jgi:hypothetical protein